MKFPYIRWMIRSSVFWILAGTMLGVAMTLAYRLDAFAWAPPWRTAHVHMLLVGGVMQMIMGVALWMFPRPPRVRQWPTGRQGWSLYALLNGGTLLRSAIGPYITSSLTGFLTGTLGAFAQAAGIVLFIALVIPRIRGIESREAR
jgi:hypothetical protein